MKKAFAFLLVAFAAFGAFAQQNHHLNLLGQLAYPNEQLSSLWGWEAPDGTPYAIVGTNKKVSIVSLSNPAAPVQVASVPGPTTIWREMKTWGHYAYVSLDNVGSGMQIIDLQYLPDSVKFVNWTSGGIFAAHTVSIDENGIMSANGTNYAGGAPVLFDLKNDPWNPTFLGTVGVEYSHDSFTRGDTLWNANINDGHFTVWDISDKTAPVLMAEQETPFTFTHNIWPNDANTHVFTTDEVGDSYIAAYDITDLDDIKEVDRWRQPYVEGAGIVPHNVHVRNDFVITAHYTDGTVVLDGHRPHNLVEVARYDSHLQGGAGFNGVWGAFPYFKNRDWILASDMQNGLIVLQPTYQKACWLEGKITDQANGQSLFDAHVELSNNGNVLSKKLSNFSGDYATGAADAGNYSLKVAKAGYFSQDLPVALVNGQVVFQNVALVKKPSFALTGQVKALALGQLLDSASVSIRNDLFSFDLKTDASGGFSIPSFFEGDYAVFVGKWGYKTIGFESKNLNAASSPLLFELEKGYEDPFAVDLGWKVSGGSQGANWELADPIAVAPPDPAFPPLQPADETADLGQTCYVTGNNTALPGGLVFGGTALLESPLMDLTGIADPRISFASWYLAATQSGGAVTTKIKFRLYNGTQSKVVVERAFSTTAPLDWHADTVRVADHYPPGANMKLRVEVGSATAGAFYEGLFDDFKVSPGTVGTVENELLKAAFSASPNPSATAFSIQFDLEKAGAERANLLIFNALGQRVAELETEAAAGEWRVGEALAPGVYFAEIRSGGKSSAPIRLLKI